MPQLEVRIDVLEKDFVESDLFVKKITLKMSKLAFSEVTYNNKIHIKDQINLLNQRQKYLKKELIIILDLLDELENETDIQ